MPAFFPILEILRKCALICQQLLSSVFSEEEKVSGGQVRQIRSLKHDYGFVFGKNSLTSIDMCAGALSWCKIHDWFPQFYAFLTNSFAQVAHNFKVVFLIDCTTCLQFMMNHAITIEENSKQNLHIGLGSSGMSGLWFQCHSHTPMIRHLFEQIWIVVQRRQHLLSDVHATFVLL